MLKVLEDFLLVFMSCLNFVVALILNLIVMKKTHYLLNTSIQTDKNICYNLNSKNLVVNVNLFIIKHVVIWLISIL